MSAVEHLLTEPQFKAAVDALLALEVSPLVETFGALGRDGGVDAELRHGRPGSDFDGHTVFQYKFVHPSTDPRKAVTRVVAQLTKGSKGKKSEFEKIRALRAERYVVVTNVPMPRGRCDELHALWSAEVGALKQLVIWDRSRLQAWLDRHPQVGWSRSQALHEAARRRVISPLWEWTEQVLSHSPSSALPVAVELCDTTPGLPDHIVR